MYIQMWHKRCGRTRNYPSALVSSDNDVRLMFYKQIIHSLYDLMVVKERDQFYQMSYHRAGFAQLPRNYNGDLGNQRHLAKS